MHRVDPGEATRLVQHRPGQPSRGPLRRPNGQRRHGQPRHGQQRHGQPRHFSRDCLRRILLAVTALAASIPIVAPSATAVAANAAALAAPLPLTDLVVVRQTKRNSCGPAAIATLAGWLGRPTSEADVLRSARLGDDGISLAEFSRLADAHDVPGSWFRVASSGLPATPTPFVAHFSVPDEHFVVVHAVVRSHVVMADPAVGAMVVPLRAFLRRFSGRVFVPREAS